LKEIATKLNAEDAEGTAGCAKTIFNAIFLE
jgi:hypothetical protein